MSDIKSEALMVVEMKLLKNSMAALVGTYHPGVAMDMLIAKGDTLHRCYGRYYGQYTKEEIEAFEVEVALLS